MNEFVVALIDDNGGLVVKRHQRRYQSNKSCGAFKWTMGALGSPQLLIPMTRLIVVDIGWPKH